jgi:tripartite-type tricarboxylate transporter receptor subunit TctC
MTGRLGLKLAFVLAPAILALAHAQPYPNRPIRLIVPSGPGSAPDISSRMFAQEVGRQVGQQVVADNRPGASGSIGYELLAKAPPGRADQTPRDKRRLAD